MLSEEVERTISTGSGLVRFRRFLFHRQGFFLLARLRRNFVVVIVQTDIIGHDLIPSGKSRQILSWSTNVSPDRGWIDSN
jgi:hypothetical protein